jgi:hypothetical protein
MAVRLAIVAKRIAESALCQKFAEMEFVWEMKAVLIALQTVESV